MGSLEANGSWEEALVSGINVIANEAQERPPPAFPSLEDASRKCHLSFPLDTDSASTLNLVFPAFRTVRNKNKSMWLINHCVYGVSLEQPKQIVENRAENRDTWL